MAAKRGPGKGGKKVASKEPLPPEEKAEVENFVTPNAKDVELFLTEVALDPAPVPQASMVMPHAPIDMRSVPKEVTEELVRDWIGQMRRKFQAHKKALTFQFGPEELTFPSSDQLLLPILRRLGGEWADAWIPPRTIALSHTSRMRNSFLPPARNKDSDDDSIMPPPPSSSGIPESFGIPIWSVDGFPSPNEDWKVFFGQVEGLASGTSPSALHSPGESAEAWAYLLSDSSILDEAEEGKEERMAMDPGASDIVRRFFTATRYTGDDDPDEDNASPTIAIMQVMFSEERGLFAVCFLHVTEAFRNKGCASSLLKAALAWHKERWGESFGAPVVLCMPQNHGPGCAALATKLKAETMYHQRWLQVPRVR